MVEYVIGAHSFSRAAFSEKLFASQTDSAQGQISKLACSLLGTDNVRGQISGHILSQMATSVYISRRPK